MGENNNIPQEEAKITSTIADLACNEENKSIISENPKMNHSRKEDCQIAEKENSNQVILQVKNQKGLAGIQEIKTEVQEIIAEIQEKSVISPVLDENTSAIYNDTGIDDSFLTEKE